MHRLRPGGDNTRGIREGLLTASGSLRCTRAGSVRRRGALIAAAAGLLVLCGCSAGRAGTAGSTAAQAAHPALRTAPGASARWFTFSRGRAVPVAGPAAARASYEPWTVQTHAAGILSIGSSVYIALNGWGLLELSRPAVALTAGGVSFRRFEDRRLFGGRTINGFAADSGKILLHLYRNTVFATNAPRSAPVTYARFDPTTGKLTPSVLRPSLDGWEAVEIVTVANGSWAIAWKKTLPQKVLFRYSMYSPASGTSTTIDRAAFVAAYDFTPIRKAPNAVRQLSGVAAALEAPAGSGGTAYAQVVHILLRSAPFGRTLRYSEGPEKKLESGNAALVTVPAVRAAGRVYALISAGQLLRSGGGETNAPAQKGLLPELPSGYVYTDFWTDGRTLVASWEQQGFTEVGAAGICIISIGALHWREA